MARQTMGSQIKDLKKEIEDLKKQLLTEKERADGYCAIKDSVLNSVERLNIENTALERERNKLLERVKQEESMVEYREDQVADYRAKAEAYGKQLVTLSRDLYPTVGYLRSHLLGFLFQHMDDADAEERSHFDFEDGSHIIGTIPLQTVFKFFRFFQSLIQTEIPYIQPPDMAWMHDSVLPIKNHK